MSKVSVAGAARKAKSEDKKIRKTGFRQFSDSYQNFVAQMGLGADDLFSGSNYSYNPITKVRTLLEWIHRGSWLGGVAVDLVADDMTRMGVDIRGQLPPDDVEKIAKEITRLQIWNKVNETAKWARLYGGAIGVLLIDGQDMKTPLMVDRVGPGQFKGLCVLDRWMLDPSLSDLVTEFGPELGKPKYYNVVWPAPALGGKKIHYSRCLRMEGLKLPYQQQLQENLWGLSILERIYDRMVAFDSATTGAAQLVFKAYLRTYKIKDLRSNIASGGPVADVLIRYLDMMRRFQSMEGVTLIDGDDEFQGHTHSAFSGLRDALLIFNEQLSGALQIPLVRLFGQSPAGLNSSGESDLKTYYDNIRNQQESCLLVPLTLIYLCCAKSLGLQVDQSFSLEFRSLWQETTKEKADIAKTNTSSIIEAYESGVIDAPTAAKELRQQSRATGLFTNITDEYIEQLEMAPPPGVEQGNEGAGESESGEQARPTGAPLKKAKQDDCPICEGTGKVGVKRRDKTPNGKYRAVLEEVDCSNCDGTGKIPQRSVKHDSLFNTSSSNELKIHHGLSAVIETPKGTLRKGSWGEHILPADYGFLRQTLGADGDELDCYIGPAPESPYVFIIDQQDLRGNFDEHKVMLGYYTQESAIEDYISGFHDGTGKRHLRQVTEMRMSDFKNWLDNGNTSQPVGATLQ